MFLESIDFICQKVWLQKSFASPTYDTSLKEIPFNPSLISIESGEENDCDEDTSFKDSDKDISFNDNGDNGRTLFSSKSYLFLNSKCSFAKQSN